MTAPGSPYRTSAAARSGRPSRTWKGRVRSFWRKIRVQFSGSYKERRTGSVPCVDGNGDALVERAPRHVRRLGGLTCWHPMPFSLRDESFMRLLIIKEESTYSYNPAYDPPDPFGEPPPGPFWRT